MRTLAAVFFVLALAVPAAAQRGTPPPRRPVRPPPPPLPPAPTLTLRPFFVGTAQAFAATNTFDATFGRTYEPFFGGGLQAVFKGRYYVEAAASRFKKTGQRAFRSNGENFGLGLPLTAEITPLEITGGLRFRLRRHPKMIPYVGGGFGSYSYKETSPSSDPAENVETRHAGAVLTGGAEFRLYKWVSLGLDGQYTHVPGILGTGGISLQAGEKDLGGVAARIKVVVGR